MNETSHNPLSTAPSRKPARLHGWVQWALIALVLLSAASRIPGLFYGFPEIVMRDETTYPGVALEMLQEGRLDPKEYRHGNFLHFFYLAIFSILYYPAKWLGIYPSAMAIPEWHFYLLARGLSLLASLGSLLLLFRLGRRLFSSIIGILASVLLALNPIFFRYGQLGKLDIYVLFLSLLAANLFLSLYERGGRKLCWGAGVVIGVGVATKYNMVSLGPALLLSFWFLHRRVSSGAVPAGQASWRFLIEASAIAVALAILLNLPVLANFEEAFRQIERQYRITVHGEHFMAPQLQGLGPWNLLTRYLPDTLGWPLELLALAGWIYWCVRDWRLCVIVSLYPVVHYTLVCRWGFAFPRELLPLYPPLCLGAALAIEGIHRWSRRWEKGEIRLAPFLLAGVCLISLVHPLQRTFEQQRLMVRGNTKVLAKRWAQSHIPATAKIARDAWVLPMRETHPRELFVYTLGYHPYDYYVEQGVAYLMKGRLPKEVLAAHPEVAANDREIERRAELLAAWNNQALERIGPDLAVYRVVENASPSQRVEAQKDLDSPGGQ